jgi:hypothetical protein
MFRIVASIIRFSSNDCLRFVYIIRVPGGWWRLDYITLSISYTHNRDDTLQSNSLLLTDGVAAWKNRGLVFIRVWRGCWILKIACFLDNYIGTDGWHCCYSHGRCAYVDRTKQGKELVGTAECITCKRGVAETEVIRTKFICILNNALTLKSTYA